MLLALALLIPPTQEPEPVAPEATPSVERVGTLQHALLGEVSGIVRSSQAGIFWVHNDSGGGARLFAIDEAGEVLVPPSALGAVDPESEEPWSGLEIVGATNVDWEDIARADGLLYVADMGNNQNRRRDLGVYVLTEPDPRSAIEARADFLPIVYPDQEGFPAERWHFDCEALFVDRGALYFLTKHRREGELLGFEPGTNLYRLETRSREEPNRLRRVGSAPDLLAVTGADLSPGGERLAVLTYGVLWVFERPAQGDDWLSGPASQLRLPALRTRQVEGVAWRDDRSLLIVNEGRGLYRVALSALRAVER